MYAGIDIGSRTIGFVGITGGQVEITELLDTGFEPLKKAKKLVSNKYKRIVATGYGRHAAKSDFAHGVITEIKAHALGAKHLFPEARTVLDIGGQDTKVITVENGAVARFLMNDKCSAGTGKFLEIMANRLEVDLDELFLLAQSGTPIPISSMCTVFAESEVISQIGVGKSKPDLAAGIVESVVTRVALLAQRHDIRGKCILTGGLSHIPYFRERLASKLQREIYTHELGKYAGALGAALIAAEKCN